MPPKKGGKKTKRTKKNEPVVKAVPLADAHKKQGYAKAVKMLGNRRMAVLCTDKKERLAIIPGSLKGRNHWVNPGMIVLVNYRDYQDNKLDVIYVYNEQETKFLIRKQQIEVFLQDEHEETVGIKFNMNDNQQIDNDSSEEIDLDII